MTRVVPRRTRRTEVSPVQAFGLAFRNPVGLAAGYDKDGTAWRALARLGFGHVEIGTVTPRPQAGNPRPRLHRLEEQHALVNRMGFPSAGMEAVAARLGPERPCGVVVGVSIGPNADTPAEARTGDYLALIDRFAPLADYLAVNVSSPNTPGLRDLEHALDELLSPLVARRDEWQGRLGRPVPILVKLSPDLEALESAIAVAASEGVDGVIVGNTTLQRPGVGEAPPGGLSGAPLGRLAMERLRRAVSGDLPVVASGGVMTPEDVVARLDAGAVLVQLYTGLVYSGPRLLRHSLRALRA